VRGCARIVTDLDYVLVFTIHLACRLAEVAFAHELYRSNTLGDLRPEIVIGTRSGIPELTMLRTALRGRS
jgi:hypothetical protein